MAAFDVDAAETQLQEGQIVGNVLAQDTLDLFLEQSFPSFDFLVVDAA